MRFWSVAKPGATEEPRQLDVGEPVGSCAYSPDGSRMTTADDSKRICVFDVKSLQRLFSIDVFKSTGSYGSCAAFSADGRWLAGASTGEFPGYSGTASNDLRVRGGRRAGRAGRPCGAATTAWGPMFLRPCVGCSPCAVLSGSD